MARRPRRCDEPDLGERHRRPALPVRCHARRHFVHESRGKAVPHHGRKDADDRDAAARLAPGGEAHRVHRPGRPLHGGVGQPDRLRTVLLAQRGPSRRRRPRPVLLPAQARRPGRGTALERHLRVRTGVHRDARRHHPCDRSDRDHPGRVPDGGDPLRAARALRRPQRRPLGLHLQHHQDLPVAWAPLRVPGPQADHDDRPVHARLH